MIKPQKESEKPNDLAARVIEHYDTEIRKNTDPSICPDCGEHRSPNEYGWYCFKCREQYPRDDLNGTNKIIRR